MKLCAHLQNYHYHVCLEVKLLDLIICIALILLLLLLLSHFSHVRLCVTPETAAHQAPPSLGFSRQEHWSGLPFPPPMHESESEVAQLSDSSDPMDCSLPGSSIHGIFQATANLQVHSISMHTSTAPGKTSRPHVLCVKSLGLE